MARERKGIRRAFSKDFLGRNPEACERVGLSSMRFPRDEEVGP